MMQQDKKMKEIKVQYLQIFSHLLFVTGNTPADDNTKNVEIIVPIKNLSNFWRNL